MTTIEFEPNPKMPRLNRDCIITEKCDGTSSCVIVQHDGMVQAGSKNRLLTLEQDNFGFAAWVKAHEDELRGLGVGLHRGEFWGHGIQRGYGLPQGERRFSLFNTSRWNKALFEENEMARYLREVEKAKRRMFNTPPSLQTKIDSTIQHEGVLELRPFVAPPKCCSVVPVLHRGLFSTPTVEGILEHLRRNGSQAAPGFPKPEGIVIYHCAGGAYFKVTCENDAQPKGDL